MDAGSPTAGVKERKELIVKVIFVLLLILTLAIAGCTTTDVRTDNWSLAMNRLMTDTGFDEAVITLDSNGVTTISFKKFRSEAQQLADIIEKMAK